MIGTVVWQRHRAGEMDLICPAMICTICQEPVVRRGNVCWFIRHDKANDWTEVERSPLYVVHKQPCSRVLDQWADAVYPIEDGWAHPWEEAGTFMRQLAQNFSEEIPEEKDCAVIVRPVGGLVRPLPQLNESQLYHVRARRREFDASCSTAPATV